MSTLAAAVVLTLSKISSPWGWTCQSGIWWVWHWSWSPNFYYCNTFKMMLYIAGKGCCTSKSASFSAQWTARSSTPISCCIWKASSFHSLSWFSQASYGSIRRWFGLSFVSLVMGSSSRFARHWNSPLLQRECRLGYSVSLRLST